MSENIVGEDITPEDSVVPVYLVPQTAEEIAELEQFAIEQAEREAEKLAEEKARVEARESALKKLAKLGLTQDEVLSLIA